MALTTTQNIKLYLRNKLAIKFTIYIHFSDIQSLTQCLISDLDAVSEWATNNKMFINTTKTKAKLVTGKRIARKLGQDTVQCLKIMLDKTEISEVTRLLGVNLDRNIAYDLHIDELCKKLS